MAANEIYYKRKANHECTYCGAKLPDNYKLSRCANCVDERNQTRLWHDESGSKHKDYVPCVGKYHTQKAPAYVRSAKSNGGGITIDGNDNSFFDWHDIISYGNIPDSGSKQKQCNH